MDERILIFTKIRNFNIVLLHIGGKYILVQRFKIISERRETGETELICDRPISTMTKQKRNPILILTTDVACLLVSAIDLGIYRLKHRFNSVEQFVTPAVG